MNILFAGTPDYAVPSLKALMQLKPTHEVCGIITQPDRVKGRGNTKPTPPPVKAAAREAGFPENLIFQPTSINKNEVLEVLAKLECDVLCVIAYGNILGKKALALPKRFAINAHGSLLPHYRGASPIQSALLNGDEKTGISIMQMELKMDSGPVMFQRELTIQPEDTAGSLHDKLAFLSADCLVKAVNIIEEGQAIFAAQDHSQATYCHKLEKKDSIIPWSKDAASIERHIRAMTPWPGAWTTLCDKKNTERRIRVVKAYLTKNYDPDLKINPNHADLINQPVCGAVFDGKANDHSATGGQRLRITCGDGNHLHITEIQPQGKREMTVSEFLRGAGRSFADGFTLKA